MKITLDIVTKPSATIYKYYNFCTEHKCLWGCDCHELWSDWLRLLKKNKFDQTDYSNKYKAQRTKNWGGIFIR